VLSRSAACDPDRVSAIGIGRDAMDGGSAITQFYDLTGMAGRTGLGRRLPLATE
jgi:hypothetical protein